MVRSGHSTARSGVLADRPILVEGSSTRDGGLVDLLVLVDVVDRSVASDLSLVGHAATRVVGTVVLENVILDKWSSGPAIDGEIGIARRLERSGKSDISRWTRRQ